MIDEIHARGWSLGTSGNFSVTLSREPLRLAITPSGHDKGKLSEELLLIVDERGERLGDGADRPSAETALHVTLAQHCGAGAVLHTHSVAATVLSKRHLARGRLTIAGYEMLKGLEGIDTHEASVDIPIVGNTQDMRALSREVERLIESEDPLYGFLIAGHGLYAWGESLDLAKRHLEVLEFLLECSARCDPSAGSLSG